MKRRNSKAGFTLVEVLAATVIASVGLIAVHAALGRCVTAIRRSDETLALWQTLESAAVDRCIRSWRASATAPPAVAGVTAAEKDTEVSGVLMKTVSFEAVLPSGARAAATLLVPKDADA